MISNVTERIDNIWLPTMGGNAAAIGLGFELAAADNTTEDHMGPATAVTCWQKMQTAHPGLRRSLFSGTPARRPATVPCSSITWRRPSWPADPDAQGFAKVGVTVSD